MEAPASARSIEAHYLGSLQTTEEWRAMDCGVQGSLEMLTKTVYYNSDNPAAQGNESAEEDYGNQIDYVAFAH